MRSNLRTSFRLSVACYATRYRSIQMPRTTETPEPLHPGPYIKDRVLPAGLSVKAAAELLGVGRPALSNLLNGKAALSPEMALRIEKTFGVSQKELLQMQAAFDQNQ